MEVILLQAVERLGQLGDTVRVKPGYGRNFLIPKGRALPATQDNVARVERDRAALLRQQDELLAGARERAEALQALELEIPVQVGAEGQMFGSVGVAEIVAGALAAGVAMAKKELRLSVGRLHELGEHQVQVRLHPKVELELKVKLVGAGGPGTS